MILGCIIEQPTFPKELSVRKSAIAIIFLLIATTSAVAGKAKATEPTPEEKKVCRDSTTIIDMMAEARDQGKTLKDARDQRIGYTEMKKMLTATGKQVTDAQISEATETMIDVVFIKMANYPRTSLIANYFNMCIQEIGKPNN